MTSTVPAEPGAEPDQGLAPESSRPARWLLRYGADWAVGLAFALLAAWLTHGLWPAPAGRALALNQQDQVLYEWLLANDARVLSGDVGLLADGLNAPDGVNLLANTSVIALGVLLAPVTVLFGAPTTFALLAAGNLALTALAWYLLYTRTLGAGRPAAALGAGLCGFAPGMVSQSNGHLHMTAQWLVPVLVWLVVRLLRAADPTHGPGGGTDGHRIVTSALGLAAVAVVQVFVGEEVLLLAAISLVLVAAGYTVLRPALIRRAAGGFAAGMSLAMGLALVALAYPLWFQFAGPQSVRGGLFDLHVFSADRASWLTFSPLSLAGGPSAARLAPGAAEYNTFLGWPLMLVLIGCAIWLVRSPLGIACAGAALVMADLSLGPHLMVNGVRSSIPGPYALLADLPLFQSALPTRFALAVVPLLATVLVLAVDRALAAPAPPSLPPGDPEPAKPPAGRARFRRSARFAVPGLVVAGLVPIFPTPLPTADRPPVPEFVTGGHWRDCVQPGGVLVPVPLPTADEPWAMRWGAATDAGFGLPEGLFIGPYGPGGNASMGTGKRPTSTLLADVAKTGAPPAVGDRERRQARLDLDFWLASCVVLDPGAPHPQALYTTLSALFGPPTRIADVWAWKLCPGPWLGGMPAAGCP
ncbi:MAG TPA: hypothetical protein VI357_20640 [Mycobacteriales bacterium]